MLEQGLKVEQDLAEVRGVDLRAAIALPAITRAFSKKPDIQTLIRHVAQLLPDGLVSPERIYVTASIAASAEGFDSGVLGKVLAAFGAASNCRQLKEKLEAIAAFGPFDEDGLRSTDLDLGAALEALVVLSERGTERSGELAASTAVRLASTRPEVALALAASTNEVISKRRKPLAQGLTTLAIALSLVSTEAKSQLESDSLWRETGLKDLAAAFHRNDLGKLLTYSAFSAINVILQDCCSARPSYSANLPVSVRSAIENKICRRVKDSLVKFSAHSPQHFKHVLSIALECADPEGERRVQMLAKQIICAATERSPEERSGIVNYLTKEIYDRGDTRAAELLQAILQPDELKEVVSKTLQHCRQRRRIFERTVGALLILSQDDASAVIEALTNAPYSALKLGSETRVELLRAVDRDAKAYTGMADQLLGCGVMNLVLTEIAGPNSALAISAATTLARSALSNSQQQSVMTSLVEKIPSISAAAFAQLREQAPQTVSAVIAPAIAHAVKQLLDAPGVQPDHVVRCAAFVAACCRERHQVAAAFERAEVDDALRPWIAWVDISRQITIEVAIARVLEKPVPAESVFAPWLRRVLGQVDSHAGFDQPQKAWVSDQVKALQRRSLAWSSCITQAIYTELGNAVPATASFNLLISITEALANSSYGGARALWQTGVHRLLAPTENAELIELITLGKGSNSDYTRAALARGVSALKNSGDLSLIADVGSDRASNRELVRQLADVLRTEVLSQVECFNLIRGIKQLLLEEVYASEPFTHAILASTIEDQLNRQIDLPYEMVLLSDSNEYRAFEQLTLEVLDIVHARRRGQ